MTENAVATTLGILILSGGVAIAFWIGWIGNQYLHSWGAAVGAAIAIAFVGLALSGAFAPQTDCHEYTAFEQDTPSWQETQCIADNGKAGDVYAVAMPLALLVSAGIGYGARASKRERPTAKAA